jgi:porphobilinogen synthase
MSTFPARRMRRLRQTPALRALVAETTLHPADFIAPLFVREGLEEPQPIDSLPGVYQHSLESLVAEAKQLVVAGIRALVLFGVPLHKDAIGSGASAPEGIVQVALSALKDALGDTMVLIADLCLDEYTDHGHCGVLDEAGRVDNDATLLRYAEVARAQADAGADFVAPSGMMDGQVGAIRSALDAHGYQSVGILAYSAKYASSLYGPFRDAVDVSIVGGGDRRAYQQDPPNAREALVEVDLDVAEGADIVMVKPALFYLDIIKEVRERVETPVAAYQVSGEYSMLLAAVEKGFLDRDVAMMESLTAIKRAGADLILTYFAKDAAELLAHGR